MYTVIILLIWRDILVCMSLCVYVQSSQEYFVRPITLLHQTVQGVGSDTHSWCYSASSWLHCWVHFKDQTRCRRHDRITCGSLWLRHGKHGGPEAQSKFYKTNGRNSIFQNITKKPPQKNKKLKAFHIWLSIKKKNNNYFLKQQKKQVKCHRTYK